MAFISSLLILFSLVSSEAFASYPNAKPNKNLREEIRGDQDRIIPSNDYFLFAVDGQAFHRFSESEDFYHGTGYWLQVRSKVSPTEYFSINLRTILYSGTSSDGYAKSIGFYNLLNLSGHLPNKFLGGKLSGKVLDLGRQTVGRGLLIQDREFQGGHFQWERGGFKIFLRGSGTGGIVHDDDTYNLEMSMFDDFIGLGALHYGEKDRDGYQFIYSSYSFSDFFTYDMEAGVRKTKWAGLLALNIYFETEQFSMRARAEGRLYEQGFGEEIVGQISQDYVSFDQLDKAYTNVMNAFTLDDELNIYALNLDLNYKFNHNWRIHLYNEVGQFDFKNQKEDNYYFYRFGIEYYPLQNRNENIVLFTSNKILTESRSIPPNLSSQTNTPMFTEDAYIGLEANFKF